MCNYCEKRYDVDCIGAHREVEMESALSFQALWISRSPDWVSSMQPPTKWWIVTDDVRITWINHVIYIFRVVGSQNCVKMTSQLTSSGRRKIQESSCPAPEVPTSKKKCGVRVR